MTERGDFGLILSIFGHVTDGTERKYEYPQTGKSVFLPRFEPLNLTSTNGITIHRNETSHHNFTPYMVYDVSRIIYILFIYLFTAVGLLPGGSGYFTCIQNMKLVTNKFKSGGLHEKHVVATWNVGNHLSICL